MICTLEFGIMDYGICLSVIIIIMLVCLTADILTINVSFRYGLWIMCYGLWIMDYGL